MQTCTCNSSHIHAHASKEKAIRIDPTRTATLRKKMIADVNRRFKKLKQQIWDAIVTKDVFGLKPMEHSLKVNVEPKQFNFSRSSDKVNAFMAWLKLMEEQGILTIVKKPGSRLGVAAEGAWTDVYIDSAYKQGIRRAAEELKKAGIDIPIPAGELGVDAVSLSFNMPIHADSVGLLYSRTFSELKGITSAMDQQISSILSQALLEGRGAEVTARLLNDRVDKIGITRARTLARTEIVRAHHLASVQEYENAGLVGVTIKSEWLTAGFNVCPKCAPLNGKVFEVKEIKAMIPRHPNCRCVAIPHIPQLVSKKPVVSDSLADYVPSKDIKAVESYLYSNLKIHSINGSNKSLNLDYGNQAAAWLTSMLQARPAIKDFIQKRNIPLPYLDVLDSTHVRTGITGTYDSSTNTITVGGKLKKKSVFQLGKSAWNVDIGPRGTLIHEYGHLIQDKGLSLKEKIQWRKLSNSLGKDYFTTNVSKYASTNTDEGFAESFLAWAHPDYASSKKKLPKEIEDFFTEIIK